MTSRSPSLEGCGEDGTMHGCHVGSQRILGAHISTPCSHSHQGTAERKWGLAKVTRAARTGAGPPPFPVSHPDPCLEGEARSKDPLNSMKGKDLEGMFPGKEDERLGSHSHPGLNEGLAEAWRMCRLPAKPRPKAPPLGSPPCPRWQWSKSASCSVLSLWLQPSHHPGQRPGCLPH